MTLLHIPHSSGYNHPPRMRVNSAPQSEYPYFIAFAHICNKIVLTNIILFVQHWLNFEWCKHLEGCFVCIYVYSVPIHPSPLIHSVDTLIFEENYVSVNYITPQASTAPPLDSLHTQWTGHTMVKFKWKTEE